MNRVAHQQDAAVFKDRYFWIGDVVWHRTRGLDGKVVAVHNAHGPSIEVRWAGVQVIEHYAESNIIEVLGGRYVS